MGNEQTLLSFFESEAIQKGEKPNIDILFTLEEYNLSSYPITRFMNELNLQTPQEVSSYLLNDNNAKHLYEFAIQKGLEQSTSKEKYNTKEDLQNFIKSYEEKYN